MIRYNVVAVEGIFGVPQLTARFRDNGEQGQVIIRLKDYDLTTRFSNTLLTIDSDRYAASEVFQKQTVFDCDADYVEVELIRTGASSLTALGIIQLGRTLC